MTDDIVQVRGRQYFDVDGQWRWDPEPAVSNAERICELLDALLMSEARIDQLQEQLYKREEW